MRQGEDAGARVRIKAGYFAGREGTLAPEEGGNDPARMRVLFKRDGFAFFNLGDLEFLPPTRDVTAILCGVGYWQQQDPMRRQVHFVGEPVVAGNIRGHVVTVHVIVSRGHDIPGFDTREIKFTTPASAAEVVAALDHLVAQPPGTRAHATTPDAEALAIHADRTPAYYGPAEGIS